MFTVEKFRLLDRGCSLRREAKMIFDTLQAAVNYHFGNPNSAPHRLGGLGDQAQLGFLVSNGQKISFQG